MRKGGYYLKSEIKLSSFPLVVLVPRFYLQVFGRELVVSGSHPRLLKPRGLLVRRICRAGPGNRLGLLAQFFGLLKYIARLLVGLLGRLRTWSIRQLLGRLGRSRKRLLSRSRVSLCSLLFCGFKSLHGGVF